VCDFQCCKTECRVLEVVLLLQSIVKSRRPVKILIFARFRALSNVYMTEHSLRLVQFDVMCGSFLSQVEEVQIFRTECHTVSLTVRQYTVPNILNRK
jgi:hypothetical protein